MKYHRIGFSAAVLLHTGLVSAGLWWYRDLPGPAPEGTTVAVNISHIGWVTPNVPAENDLAAPPISESVQNTAAETVEESIPAERIVKEVTKEVVEETASDTATASATEPTATNAKPPEIRPPKEVVEKTPAESSIEPEMTQQQAGTTPQQHPEPAPKTSESMQQPASEFSPSAAPAVTTQAPSVEAETSDPELEQRYLAALHRALQEAMQYPHSAKRRRQQGTAWIEFRVQQEGTLSGIQLRESSGYPLLDEAALETVKSLGRFEPIPDEMARNMLTLAIPISFQLR